MTTTTTSMTTNATTTTAPTTPTFSIAQRFSKLSPAPRGDSFEKGGKLLEKRTPDTLHLTVQDTKGDKGSPKDPTRSPDDHQSDPKLSCPKYCNYGHERMCQNDTTLCPKGCQLQALRHQWRNTF